MDTTLLYSDKRIINTISLIMCFFLVSVFTVYIYAEKYFVQIYPQITTSKETSELRLNTISQEKEIAEFNQNIQKKYPQGIIYDVAKGIKHIKLTKYYDNKPVKINVIEINKKLTPNYELKPITALKKLNSKQKISDIANSSNAIIALNGTFFKPGTGIPLGTLMIDGKIYTGPIYDRVAMGIFSDHYEIERITLDASLKSKNYTLKIDNLNQPRMLSTMILIYTQDWGETAPATPKYGLQLAIKKDRVIDKSTNSLKIPDKGYVIVGPSSLLNKFNIGEKIELSLSTTPKWQDVKHIISGGPYLIKDDKIFVDMTAQKLTSIGGKNPRSAIGYTQNNDIILVAVDGRENASVGMTLMQLARLMKSFGCTQAINLDGGGSTVMYINGKIVNNPQQKDGIPIPNAIGLVPKS